ncbi:MAG: hypothetical protein HC792_05850, partial [Acaryochloridaceae cyanobacterium CSU_5_19]|nr:hypothetical protein [Acaryochloridaceae cyanobacterium CSU_5_19]
MTILIGQNSGRSIVLLKQIASSGEGTVWKTNAPGLLAKLYHDCTPERVAKLKTMVAHPPPDPMPDRQHVSLAWPQDSLMDRQGQVLGFVMPEIGESVKLSTIYNPKLRSRKAPRFNWYYLHTAAFNIASTLDAIHSQGYVVGDIKPQNILVNSQALTSIIDTDSFQIKDPDSDHIFRCLVGSEGFTPVELLGKDLGTVDQTNIHDRFRLAVIIYLLLFGDQPFKGKWIGRGDSPQPTELIQKGYWPYAPQSLIRPGPHTILLSVVHPQLQACFHQCFSQGHSQPHLRPTARQWMFALKQAIATLQTCNLEANHHFSQSYGHCYWCDRKARLGVDIFSPNPVIAKPRSRRPAVQDAASRQKHPASARLKHRSTTNYQQRIHQLKAMAVPPQGSSRALFPPGWSQQVRWPQLSNSALGLILCTVGCLGLALLLAPELSSSSLSSWSQSLDRVLENWFFSKLGQQPQAPTSQLLSRQPRP